jgi:hypothetical protein
LAVGIIRTIPRLKEKIKKNAVLIPIRENFLVKRIMKTNPDYAGVGALHVRGLHKSLAKKGYATTMSGQKADAQSAIIRLWYKKRKAKKEKSMQRKFARRKGR